MNSKTYTKSPVNLDTLIQQIEASSITEAIDTTLTSVFGDQVTVVFLSDLSDAEWTTMDNIIAAHTGQSNTSTVIIEVTSNPSVSGLEADLGSVATVVDGSGLWVKTAAPNTGWSRPLPPLASDGISTIVPTATASAGISTYSARGDHVHAIATATSSQTGLLTSTDWNLFNNKTASEVANDSGVAGLTVKDALNSLNVEHGALTTTTSGVTITVGSSSTAINIATVVGDNGTGGVQGLVPAPPAGSTAASKFLSAKGTFVHVDTSKQIPILFSLMSQTAGPIGTNKFESVTVAGNYAYVAGGGPTTTVAIYDISNPTYPILLWNTFLAGAYSVAVQGNYLYVPSSGGSRLYILDVTNPASPTQVGSVIISNSPGSLYSAAVSGNYCYLATQNKGLTVVDISNPTNPVQVFQEGGTTNKSFGVAVVGSTVYTTSYQTTAPWTVRYLKIWNATTPTAPTLTTTYTLPGGSKPLGLTVFGTTAFASDVNTNTVQIVDVSNPLAPNYLASMAASFVFNSGFVAQISGNYAYIPSGGSATYGGALDVFDITNLSSPIKVATAYTNVPNSVFGGIALANGYVYAGDYGIAPGSASSLAIFPQITTPVFGKITTSTAVVKSLVPSEVVTVASDGTLTSTIGSTGQFLTTNSGNISWSFIPTASSSQTGLLSNSDWISFENKEPAQVKGVISTSTSGVTITNGSRSTVGPNVEIDILTSGSSSTGLLSESDWITFKRQTALWHKESFVYTANGVGSVSGFVKNVDGTLTEMIGSPFPCGTSTDFPQFFTRSPDGKHLYVGGMNNSNIFGFSINEITGALTPLSGFPISTGAGPQGLKFDSYGRFMYSPNYIDGTITGFSYNPDTGSLTPLSLSPYTSSSGAGLIVIEPLNKFLYCIAWSGTVSGYTIDQNSGNLTLLPDFPMPSGLGINGIALAVIPSGKFIYTADYNSNSIHAWKISIDGILTAVSGSPYIVSPAVAPAYVTVHPSNMYLYVPCYSNDKISGWMIDQDTGMLTQIPGSPWSMPTTGFPSGHNPTACDIDQTGSYLYVASLTPNKIITYSIDKSTGVITLLPTYTSIQGGVNQIEVFDTDPVLDPNDLYQLTQFQFDNLLASTVPNDSTAKGISVANALSTLSTTKLDIFSPPDASTTYSEVTYDGSNRITYVDFYESPAKATHLFSKHFTYTGTNLTGVTQTRIADGATLVKVITYTGNKITNVSKTYTP